MSALWWFSCDSGISLLPHSSPTLLGLFTQPVLQLLLQLQPTGGFCTPLQGQSESSKGSQKISAYHSLLRLTTQRTSAPFLVAALLLGFTQLQLISEALRLRHLRDSSAVGIRLALGDVFPGDLSHPKHHTG